MEEVEEVPVVKEAVKSGALLGILLVILNFVIYAVDSTIFTNWWLMLIIFLILVVAITVLGVRLRNSSGGGYMAFGQAFLYCFVAFAVAGLINMLFNILLHTVIDPELSEYIVSETLRRTTETYENLGLPQAQVDEAIEKMEKDLPEGFTPIGQVKGYLWLLIGYAVLSLITGLIVKKNEPIADY